MSYSVEQIRKVISGNYFSETNADGIIEHLLIDSRKLLFPSTTLFFAITGPRRNGAQFINDLFLKGVRNFIVDDHVSLDRKDYPEANIIVVENVLRSLQALTAYHRSTFNIPVVGITGSNGKTIVKEWLNQLLQSEFTIVRSPKSYNSQIGVPLSVWQMNAGHTLAIFEAGISQPDEMQYLEKIIQPAIGIFTNIGEAHNEGFKVLKQKIKEKCRLFEHSNVLIFKKETLDSLGDIAAVKKVLFNEDIELISWSKASEASLTITAINKNSFKTTINGVYKNSTACEITIPFNDEASIENAITCWCYLLYIGMDTAEIAKKMLQLRSVEMRLELKQGINNCSIINDSYSADINSLAIALDFLQQQQQHQKRTLILSDILQTGKDADFLYKEIADILLQKKIDRIIGIGNEISAQINCFSQIPESFFFTNTESFLKHFSTIHFHNETVLLKGARVFEFEQISRLLEQKSHQTVLEINLNGIAHNLKVYQQLLNPGTRMMTMVKAFSYGSGSFEIANVLQFHQVDYLTVAYADEGVELRKSGITLPIMVMNAEEVTFDILVQYNLEPEIYSMAILNALEEYLQLSGIQYFPVHIKLDTGMHRLGFETSEIKELCSKLSSSSQFKIQSVFSHLAGSDSAFFDEFTGQQSKIFSENSNAIQEAVTYPFLKHIANTSAIHRHKNLQLDMVRLGIGLYGVDADEYIQQQLKNVTTLKTTIAQIKHVRSGESVGYSRKGVVDRDSVIATVRIGYADGYPRNLSNGIGKMIIKGNPVPVIGNVCMDMVMLDVTGVDAVEGDEVIVFGEDLPVADMAKWAGTIAYEILTGISQRVKRVYFEE